MDDKGGKAFEHRFKSARSLHVEVLVFVFGLKFTSETILMLRFSKRLTKTLTIFKNVQEFVQHRC